MVSHAGSRLLAGPAEVTGLTSAFSCALRRLRPRGTGHALGRVAVDLAVTLADIGPPALAALQEARATAREVAWLQAADTRDGIPASRAGGRDLPCLVLDLDATLVTRHSEKEQAAATYKRGFGYHPLLCFLDNTIVTWSTELSRPGGDRAASAAAPPRPQDRDRAQPVRHPQPGHGSRHPRRRLDQARRPRLLRRVAQAARVNPDAPDNSLFSGT
ncbi:hypothetical protein ACIQVK_42685 [Streptomyces sp. NPDC090493]|uniref:hypothetical protein n=1 Tax=Streptomyces sp. NPDC090493 TaxID=3365964 RepID=UPI00382F0D5D